MSGREETARHDVRTVPISGGLGLLDVEVSVEPREDGPTVLGLRLVGPTRGAAFDDARLVPMHHAGTDTDGRDVWTIRVWAGEGLGEQEVLADEVIEFEIVAGPPGGVQRVLGRHRAEAAPEAALATPDWAKGAVWYQIFPERWRNGNPANDPSGPDTVTLPWLSRWDRVHPEEVEAAWMRRLMNPFWFSYNPFRDRGAFANTVWHRRYGGDLQGVVEKLDYLKDLGVTAIYLCPIFEAQSMHKYDASDFRHIDATLGSPGTAPAEYEPITGETDDPATWTWTEADRYFLDVLIPEARRRGLRVVLDGVWNHTGRQHWAFQDVLEHGRDSRYHDWFYVTFDDDGRVEGWQAWDGRNGWLPKFRQTASGDLNEPVKRHIFNVTQRWMAPDGDASAGIDGWRLDVANEIGRPFWKDWRELVKGINPEAVIIGEIWFDAGAYFDGTAFDGQMNYPFAYAAADWIGLRPRTPAGEFGERLRHVFNNAPQHDLVQFNLLASHDTERVASMFHNPGRGYKQGAGLEQAGVTYDDSRPSEQAYRRSVLAVALQATYQGSPMIYGGDELGMHGADDPNNRKPIYWPDLATPDNPEDAHHPGVLDAYRSWLRLRGHAEAGPVLRYGATTHVDSGHERVFAFERRLNDRRVLVVLNGSTKVFDASGLVGEQSHAAELAGETTGLAVDGLGAAAWVIGP